MKQSIVLIVSVVVGLLAAVLTRTYLVSKDAEVRQFKDDFLKKNPPMEVLCFKRDIPSGTRISKADYATEPLSIDQYKRYIRSK